MKKLSFFLLLLTLLFFFAADADAQKKSKKDRDGDGVPNAVDRCPDLFGVDSETMQGCPDSDGDGITDGEDHCPNEKGAGVGPQPGCPDSAGAANATTPTGTVTSPNTPIIKALKGDRDGDGVPDAKDGCPDQPGPVNPGTNGCPDRDNDWVTDDQDKCPDVWGLGIYMGCPNDVEADQRYEKERQQQELAARPGIDSLREIFYRAFDNAYLFRERAWALQDFKAGIQKLTGGKSYDAMYYAIKPVMETRTVGKPWLGQEIANMWEEGTLYNNTITSMMAKKDREDLTQLWKDKYEADKKAELEKQIAANTPAPVKPRTKEEECQQKLYEAQQGRGKTYFYQNDLVIMESYDCATDLYTMWRPRQGQDGNMAPRGKRIYVKPEWGRWTPSLKGYHRCGTCDGTGDVQVVTYTTKTKELPWGYFSGIETTKTTTTKNTTTSYCKKCDGLGVLYY